jgi:hypothetical protein
MSKHAGRLILACLALGLVSSQGAFAQAPASMVHEGHIDLSQLTATCTPPFTVEFLIYATPTGGTPVWAESNGVTTDSGGDFTVLLGSTNPLTPAVFSGAVRYLGFKVCGGAEALPRSILASAPYAISAARAPAGAPAPAGLSPIAYGAVNADGTVARAGSDNWAVHRVQIPGASAFECGYGIAFAGFAFDSMRHTVVFSGLDRPAAFGAGSANGRLRVHVVGENARSLGRSFHFMVFALPGMGGD